MFDRIKSRATRTLIICSLSLNIMFVAEHGVGIGLAHAGIVQGEFRPPSVAFGGYDAQHEQQIAMLGSAIPDSLMRPPAAKMETGAPVPQHKPAVPTQY